MVTDDQIAGLFERVSQDLDPEIGTIVAQGELLGRRLRRRRRAGAAAGSALAVVVVAGISVAGGLHPSHPFVRAPGPANSPVGTGPHGHPSHATRPVPRPHHNLAGPSPKASRKASAGPGMTRHQMLGTLRRLLPAGSVLSHVVTDTTRGALEVDYNDGQGAVDLMIDVSRTWTSPPLNCPHPLWADEGTRPAGALPISCVMRNLPDGSVERDAVMYADEFGFYGYDIYDLRPDGVTVFIQVGNGINHTLPQVDRARPPGSMAEWEAVTENPAWHL
jgi:hypothetical protein